MNNSKKEAVALFICGVILLCFGIPSTLDGNAFGLGGCVFGVSFIIMSFGWRE